MAEEASFSVSRTGDRATALRESLADELEEARLVVQAAAAARKRAKRDVERLEEDIASLQKEEQTRKVVLFWLCWGVCAAHHHQNLPSML